MQGFSGGSKLGAFSASRLHSCAYIDEYFGSSRAFSKTCKNESVIHHVHVRPIIHFALTYQKNNSFEDNRRVQSNVQYVHRQFFKLLRRDLVEDPANLEGHQVRNATECIKSSNAYRMTVQIRQFQPRIDSGSLLVKL